MADITQPETTQFGNIPELLPRALRLSQQQALLVEQQLPPLAELARARKLYHAFL